MVPLCFSTFRASQPEMRLNCLTRQFPIHRRMALMNSRMNGTGSTLPATESKKFCHQPSPSPQPRGMAPLHLMMGSIAHRNTLSSRPTVFTKKFSIASTKIQSSGLMYSCGSIIPDFAQNVKYFCRTDAIHGSKSLKKEDEREKPLSSDGFSPNKSVL